MLFSRRRTLKDFSRECGISVSAVSRILNGKSTYCSASTREKVLSLARLWNYKPNIGYRIMTGMPTNITAIIFSQNRTTYLETNLRIFIELLNTLSTHEYATYSAIMTKDSEENFQKYLELERKGCRSFIFIGHAIGIERILENIKNADYHYVGINVSYNPGSPQIKLFCQKNFTFDETAAIFSYLELFKKQGRNNFRILAPQEYFTGRVLPYAENHQDAENLSCKHLDIPACEFPDSDGFDARYDSAGKTIEQAFREDSTIDGVICITDFHALGVAHFLHKAGKKVGEEVLVCGMSNTTAARFSLLPITTCNYNMEKIAEEIIKGLFDKEEFFKLIKPELINHNRGE